MVENHDKNFVGGLLTGVLLGTLIWAMVWLSGHPSPQQREVDKYITDIQNNMLLSYARDVTTTGN